MTFKIKYYLHFSDRLENNDIPWISSYVNNPVKVKSHKFYPFIHKPIKQRRFRRGKEGNNAKERSKRVKSVKARSISYANHLDRCVYSHYASKLADAYETLLKSEPLVDNAVIAYRSKKHTERKLSTPSLAKEVFDIIKEFPSDEFRVVAMDISGFFDELKYDRLKACWRDIMGFTKGLEPDHYAVFKNITRYTYIDYHEVFKAFKSHHGKNSPKHLRSSKVEGFSPTTADFRHKIIDEGLVREPKGRKDKMGIPQGSPISPVLANIYMLEFDRYVSKLMDDLGGYYRRYSDDIVLIYKALDHTKVYDPIHTEIQHGSTGLRINKAKNQVFHCKRLDAGLLDMTKYVGGNEVDSNGFEYLGFQFDGNAVRIRSGSLSKYYRKMKKGVRRSAYYAKTTSSLKGRKRIFKNMVFKKHTHLGAQRRLIYKRVPGKHPGTFKMIRTQKMDWGNFMSYGHLAARTFDGKDRKAIKRQLKGHMSKVRCEINKQTEKYDLDVVLKSTPIKCK